MRLQDTVTIAEFGSYRIKAIYDYRIEPGAGPGSILVDKIELKIEEATIRKGAPFWVHFRTITLLDIPPWMWELLNSSSMLGELDLGLPIEFNEPQSETQFHRKFL
jgi:hypothetical protein